jgi:hypothetical protein
MNKIEPRLLVIDRYNLGDTLTVTELAAKILRNEGTKFIADLLGTETVEKYRTRTMTDAYQTAKKFVIDGLYQPISAKDASVIARRHIPRSIDLERIATLLREEHIPNVVIMITGSGVSTLYAGNVNNGHYDLVAGPGWFEGPAYTNSRIGLSDFCYGSDNDGMKPAIYITRGTEESIAIELFVFLKKDIKTATVLKRITASLFGRLTEMHRPNKVLQTRKNQQNKR